MVLFTARLVIGNQLMQLAGTVAAGRVAERLCFVYSRTGHATGSTLAAPRAGQVRTTPSLTRIHAFIFLIPERFTILKQLEAIIISVSGTGSLFTTDCL